MLRRTTLMAMFVLVLCVTGFAQSAGQPQPSQPVQLSAASGIVDQLKDPAKRQQLEQALDILQKAANEQAQDTKGGGDHKTVGDALDKGLDMARETVVYLAGEMEKVAPQLWHVLVLQQYVKGFTLLVQPIGLILLAIIYRRLLLKWWKPQPGDDDAMGKVFEEVKDPKNDLPFPTHKGWRAGLTIMVPLMAIVIGAIWLSMNATEAMGYFINPNYYALKDIISLVRNPGAF